MKCAVTALVLIFSALVCAEPHNVPETGILEALNELRRNPDAYIATLEAQRKLYRGNLLNVPGKTPIETAEGVGAVDEAIAALRRISGSLEPLALSTGLSRSAAEHVRDTGGKGLVGHESTGGRGFAERVSQYGTWTGGVGETISYGESDPKGVISQLLIDDGVKDRGHRRALLDPQWRYVGIACGAHSVYGAMCVMDFAAQFRDK